MIYDLTDRKLNRTAIKLSLSDQIRKFLSRMNLSIHGLYSCLSSQKSEPFCKVNPSHLYISSLVS